MDKKYEQREGDAVSERERQNGNSTLIILINANICFTHPFFDICGMRNIVWFVKTHIHKCTHNFVHCVHSFQEIGLAWLIASPTIVYVVNRIDDGRATQKYLMRMGERSSGRRRA